MLCGAAHKAMVTRRHGHGKHSLSNQAMGKMSEKVKKEKPYTTFESKGGGFKMTNVSGDVPVAMIRGRIQKIVEATNHSSSKRRDSNAVAVTSQEVCCRKVVAGKEVQGEQGEGEGKEREPEERFRGHTRSRRWNIFLTDRADVTNEAKKVNRKRGKKSKDKGCGKKILSERRKTTPHLPEESWRDYEPPFHMEANTKKDMMRAFWRLVK